MTPLLIGYFPKRTERTPSTLAVPDHVIEICSVSPCISAGPPGWIQAWKHNDAWVFDSPELARSLVPDDAPADYELYAYRVLPILIDGERRSPWEPVTSSVTPLSDEFRSLGWDVVARTSGTDFECSPLTCNGLAAKVPVNAHALLRTPEEALALASTLSTGNAEPGPYAVVEVLRAVTRSRPPDRA